MLLRKLADQCGLTSALGAALGRKGKFPLIDRGMALVSMAVAIALGARSMSDIAVLAHQEPVFGAAPGDTTVRRTLELADARTLDKIARARAAVRGYVWQLICARPAGFPWLAIAGKLLAGWLVIDLDATLITARRPGRGRPDVQVRVWPVHPLGAWCANTAESLGPGPGTWKDPDPRRRIRGAQARPVCLAMAATRSLRPVPSQPFPGAMVSGVHAVL